MSDEEEERVLRLTKRRYAELDDLLCTLGEYEMLEEGSFWDTLRWEDLEIAPPKNWKEYSRLWRKTEENV